MKYTLGVSAGFHDAAVCLLDNYGCIEFAGHSERYSKKKNDPDLCPELVAELWGRDIEHIAYYEKPWLKQLRQLQSGQGIEWSKLTGRQILQQQLKPFFLGGITVSTHDHHLCHAAGGFQTSAYDNATVVVVDAIGEYATASIYSAHYDQSGRAAYQRLWSQSYPHSIGLFYSAVTERCGLRPGDEEYITMGMAGWGKPLYVDQLRSRSIADAEACLFKENLHLGLGEFLPDARVEDIAASAQVLAEELLTNIMRRARQLGSSNNLVYSGGVALNCLANRLWGNYFDNIWIMPNPGDGGSSLGAAALVYGRRINFTHAFHGCNIPGDYPVDNIIAELVTNKIVGVASGRAEFGPRALGNRSLLADPRGGEIKEKVNAIKRRQQFRPFAPVILEELADTYFDMPRGWHNSRYMQAVARCRVPDLFPAIVHVDGTARVQTVPPGDTSGIRKLLEKWYDVTGCPMLLNTSLNIRGEPMVNDRSDADRFEALYKVKVCS